MNTPCFKCKAPAVIYQRYSGRYLCAEHLKEDVMIRVRRTIRKQGGLGRKKIFALIWKGDFRNLLLYCIGDLLVGRKDVTLLLFEVEDHLLKAEDFSIFLPPSVKINPIKVNNEEIIDLISSAGCDRLFSASYLEEESIKILSLIFSGDSSGLIQPAFTQKIRYIMPFREIPGEELSFTSIYSGVSCKEYLKCVNNTTKLFLIKLSEKHPSVPFSLIRYEDRLREIDISGQC